jgi:putative sporulation protein YtaF
MELISIIFLTTAISIDSFSVGITYGLRRIKLGIIPLFIISLISSLAIYLTLMAGSGIAYFLEKRIASILGSLILMGIGVCLLYTAYFNNPLKNDNLNNKLYNKTLLFSFSIKPFGIIINILKEPVEADMDNSGTINIYEALFLGIALAMDALGAGFGAGLTGISIYILPLFIGIANIIFVLSGFLIGKKLGYVLPDYFNLLPGLIIIILAFVKFFQEVL